MNSSTSYGNFSNALGGYQLNPHFLFNTLNAISTLILDGANETANQAVSRLSDFLRYTLDNDPMKRVTLGSELSAIDLYLEIEKVRFGDRLIIEKSIEAKAQDALVPSLILQPLIENAIKYAITPSEEGGTLRISARVQHKTLVLQISDSGPGLGNGNNGQKSSGVGLKNTRERLQQLYGDSQAFTLAPNEPRGLRITINIPTRSMMIKALIVDDEELARRGLELRLEQFDDIEICGQSRNGREALVDFREQSPDVMFLDIQMPGMDGFDVLQRLAGSEIPSSFL